MRTFKYDHIKNRKINRIWANEWMMLNFLWSNDAKFLKCSRTPQINIFAISNREAFASKQMKSKLSSNWVRSRRCWAPYKESNTFGSQRFRWIWGSTEHVKLMDRKTHSMYNYQNSKNSVSSANYVSFYSLDPCVESWFEIILFTFRVGFQWISAIVVSWFYFT